MINFVYHKVLKVILALTFIMIIYKKTAFRATHCFKYSKAGIIPRQMRALLFLTTTLYFWVLATFGPFRIPALLLSRRA